MQEGFSFLVLAWNGGHARAERLAKFLRYALATIYSRNDKHAIVALS